MDLLVGLPERRCSGLARLALLVWGVGTSLGRE